MMEILNNFHFIRPIWLLAALPVIPALWLLWRRWHTGKAWSSVIAPELLPHLSLEVGSPECYRQVELRAGHSHVCARRQRGARRIPR